MNATPNAVLSRFLLGSELVDSFTFAEFQSFFPSKYSSPEAVEEIRKLHTIHNSRRRDARSAVKKSIKQKCKEVDRQMNRKKRRNPVYAHSLKECTEFLAMLVKAKEEELNNLNTQLANQRKQLNSFTKELDAVDLEHVSNSSEYTKNVEKFVKSLS